MPGETRKAKGVGPQLRKKKAGVVTHVQGARRRGQEPRGDTPGCTPRPHREGRSLLSGPSVHPFSCLFHLLSSFLTLPRAQAQEMAPGVPRCHAGALSHGPSGHLTGQYGVSSPRLLPARRHGHPGCQPSLSPCGKRVRPSDHLKFKRNPGLLVSVSRI